MSSNYVFRCWVRHKQKYKCFRFQQVQVASFVISDRKRALIKVLLFQFVSLKNLTLTICSIAIIFYVSLDCTFKNVVESLTLVFQKGLLGLGTLYYAFSFKTVWFFILWPKNFLLFLSRIIRRIRSCNIFACK